MSSVSSNGQSPVAARPLRTVLFLALAGLAVLVLVTAALSWGRYSYVRNVKEVRERLGESAYLVGRQLAGQLESHRQVVIMVGRELDERQLRERGELERVMRRARESNPGILSMVATGASGEIVAVESAVVAAGLAQDPAGMMVVDRAYFARPRETGRPHISDVFRGRGLGNQVIVAVSAPLRDAAGNFDGVVEASLDLNRLSQLKAGTEVGTLAAVVILDAKQQVVFSSDHGRYPRLSIFDGFSAAGAGPARLGVAEAELRSADGRTRDVIYGWAKLRVAGMDGDWLVVVEESRDLIRDQMREQLAYLGWGVLAATLIAGLLAGAIARGVTRPVERLAALARTRARDPDAAPAEAPEPGSIREIVEMARDFSAMHEKVRATMAELRRALQEKDALARELMESRGALEASHRQLELRVEERTRVLQQLVERSQAEVQLRIRVETQLEMLNRELGSIARGSPLRESLDSIIEGLERDEPDVTASVMVLADNGRHLEFGAGPGLPGEYVRAIRMVPVGPESGSCGTAAYRRERVIVADLMTDPLWVHYREPARISGFRACWSAPILGVAGELLGTFAVYHRQVCQPTGDQLAAIDRASAVAAVALDRDKAERARLRLEDKLRQARKLEALGTLAGGVAHGFNNLLVPILSYAELLKLDPRVPEGAGRGLDEIVRASRQARSLVQQMLAFSRHDVPQLERMKLGRIVAEAGALLRVTAEAGGVELVLETGAEDPTLQADPAQLHHLLMNLGNNALQATPRGGRVTVRAALAPPESVPREAPGAVFTDRVVCLEVSDTGTGIAPEVQERMFEPFFTTKPTGRGSGLGLAVVHGIVRSHRGAITVKSALGQGTVFRVFLAAESVTPESPAANAPAVRVRATSDAVVLVVDDEPVVVQVTAALLVAHGFRVHTAAGGEAALAWLNRLENACDLLLTDVTMPGMSGLDLVREARRLRPALPVLVATGHGGLEAGRAAELRAPFRVLAKPIDVVVLVATVDALMGEARRG